MRILWVGQDFGNSRLRADALRRIGHTVTHVDPYAKLPRHWARYLYRTGGPGIDSYVARILENEIPRQVYEAAVVNQGEIIGPRGFAVLKRRAAVVGNFVNDNPFVVPSAERHRWNIYHRTCASYDVVFVPRRPGWKDSAARFGVVRVQPYWFMADEIVHRPVIPDGDRRWISDVVFVGTWMQGRGAFIEALVARGVPIRVYGARWEKAPEYERLRNLIDGPVYTRDYASAIAGAKIGLCLLNAENADSHTSRSAEIPAIGTLLCAPRTEDHKFLFAEDQEAVFFGDVDECAEKCKALLHDHARRAAIARAGHERVKRNGTFNEPTMRAVVEALAESSRS